MSDASLKRKFADAPGGGGGAGAKVPRLGGGCGGGGGGGGKMSFAQKMMAKMGYVEGGGLGKDGEGMVNPIEVKLRPQGAGVGTIKERTEQYKAEQRRAAERRGEEYEGSSEEERRARKERRSKKAAAARSDGQSGASTPSGFTRRPKLKFRSVEDVQAAAPGLDVPPQMLSAIIDATGSETKLLTSAAGLMTPTLVPSAAALTEEEKITKRERLELEAFIDAWHGVQEQKILIEQHEGHLQLELDQRTEELERLQKITDAVDGLQLERHADDSSAQFATLVDKLESLQNTFKHDIERYGLADAAIGAIGPQFKIRLAEWEPIERPSEMTDYLTRIKPLLGLDSQDDLVASNDYANLDEVYGRSRRKKTTTAYETLIYTTWLPKIRTTVNHWSVIDYGPMIDLVNSWRPLLAPFVYNALMDQSIVPKLMTALQTWDPRRRSHHHRHSVTKNSFPHTWIFPWLPYLPPHHLDIKASRGLLVDCKRKLGSVLGKWDVNAGLLPGIDRWREVIGPEFDSVLIRHLLPHLAEHLSQFFDVDPSDQDLTPLERVLDWQPYFKTDVFARLLAAEFFPKWLATLHIWLTAEDANFEEIGQWTIWWMSQIPEKLSNHPDVVHEWNRGQDMIKDALDLLEQGLPIEQLPPPPAGPPRPIAKEIVKGLDKPTSNSAAKIQISEPVDYKEIVESWCVDEDLTMLPTREAHSGTGLPLFRITASATGKGGVLVYLQGDIVWAQRKGDRTVFDPIGLDERLVLRAEGK